MKHLKAEIMGGRYDGLRMAIPMPGNREVEVLEIDTIDLENAVMNPEITRKGLPKRVRFNYLPVLMGIAGILIPQSKEESAEF